MASSRTADPSMGTRCRRTGERCHVTSCTDPGRTVKNGDPLVLGLPGSVSDVAVEAGCFEWKRRVPSRRFLALRGDIFPERIAGRGFGAVRT
jgi:hypothetical protein